LTSKTMTGRSGTVNLSFAGGQETSAEPEHGLPRPSAHRQVS
jgi:hypothetical protein